MQGTLCVYISTPILCINEYSLVNMSIILILTILKTYLAYRPALQLCDANFLSAKNNKGHLIASTFNFLNTPVSP